MIYVGTQKQRLAQDTSVKLPRSYLHKNEMDFHYLLVPIIDSGGHKCLDSFLISEFDFLEFVNRMRGYYDALKRLYFFKGNPDTRFSHFEKYFVDSHTDVLNVADLPELSNGRINLGVLANHILDNNEREVLIVGRGKSFRIYEMSEGNSAVEESRKWVRRNKDKLPKLLRT